MNVGKWKGVGGCWLGVVEGVLYNFILVSAGS